MDITVKTWNDIDTQRVKKRLQDEGNTDALAYIRILETTVKEMDATLARAMKKIHELATDK